MKSSNVEAKKGRPPVVEGEVRDTRPIANRPPLAVIDAADIRQACFAAAHCTPGSSKLEFSIEAFAKVLGKTMNRPIDETIARAVLAGRSYLEALDAETYRIVQDSRIDVNTKRVHKGQVIEEGGRGSFERWIDMSAKNRYELVETLDQLARVFRATRRASVLESEGPQFVIMIGERAS